MAETQTPTDTASVARAYFGAIAKCDLDAMTALWAPGAADEIHGIAELRVPGTYREWFGNMFKAFPDFHFEVLELVADGEKAAVRWRASGTFEGEGRFQGLVPNGSRVDLTGFDLLTVRDGLIHRSDAYLNGAQMAQQLGALPLTDSLPERAMLGAINLKTRAVRGLRRGSGRPTR